MTTMGTASFRGVLNRPHSRAISIKMARCAALGLVHSDANSGAYRTNPAATGSSPGNQLDDLER
jgi:hypothetical protein